jgi:hypothetical protein
MTLLARFLAALLGVVPALAAAQQSDSLAARCATRDTATAWLRRASEWSTEVPGAWTNDSLRTVLIALADADAVMRRLAAIPDSMRSPAFLQRLGAHDAIEEARMRQVVNTYGWPTRTMVGARGASAAFRIAQFNPDVLLLAVYLMPYLPAREVNQAERAVLEDIASRRDGLPQRFGTQLKPNGFELHPVDTVARLEARRADVGLPPMTVSLCMMRASGNEVRFPPEERPIAKRRVVHYWMPHLRFHVGIPQTVSAALGASYVMERARDLGTWGGLLMVVEPGLHAGKLRFGYGSGRTNGVGVSGTVALLNYWGDEGKHWSKPDRDYMGGELHVSGKFLDFGIGVYESTGNGRLRFAMSLGAGL